MWVETMSKKEKFAIMFVCSGNTCRSPMAEGYFRKICAKAGIADMVKILSAGTNAIDGVPPSDYAIKILKDKGVDTSEFHARIIRSEDLKIADLIVVMTEKHKQFIIHTFDGIYKDKVHLLSEFGEDGTLRDIDDPFCGNMDIYLGCFEQMKPALDNLLLHIISTIKK